MNNRTKIVTKPWDGIPARPPMVRKKPMQKQLGGVPDSTLHDWIRNGVFPMPVNLGPRMVAWPQAWIDAWLQDRATRQEKGL